MKKTVHLASFLLVVSLVSGAVLAGMNALTYDKINEAKLAAEIDNLRKIFPDASFTEETVSNDDSNLIEKIFVAEGEGYVYKASAQGFSNPITIMVGIDNDGKIVGYEVVSFNDTPGIGDAVMSDSFKETIVGINSNDQVATISGATVSSSAVVKALEAAKTHFNALKGITGPGEGPKPIEKTIDLNDEKTLISSDEVAQYTGEIINTSDEGNIRTYTVKVNGYGMVDDDGSHGMSYEPHEIAIQVNMDSKTLESIEYVVFGDTPGIGDATQDEAYYEVYQGLSLTDYQQGVDTVSGATRTSLSMISAVRIVMDDLNK